MIKLSEDLFVIYLRIIWFILVIPIIYTLSSKDYFLVLILLFPLIGWALVGKIFSLKRVSFNELKIFVNDNEYLLKEIEDLRIKPFKKSFIKIDGKKHYFTAPFSELKIDNKKSALLNRIDKQKGKTLHNNV